MRDNHRVYRYLDLGDSYTIGEGVASKENFPHQLVYALAPTLEFLAPRIVATTGWTTGELMKGINEAELEGQQYDWVTLLIGVNNQYRGQALQQYEVEFTQLLERAISFAGNNPRRVIVLSIPDWGVTPFAVSTGKDRSQIAREIDQFNQINQAVSAQKQVHYANITASYREIGGKQGYYVEDQLHPSAAVYNDWAKRLRKIILSETELSNSVVPAAILIKEDQNTTDVFYAQKVSYLNPRDLVTCDDNTPFHDVAEKMAQEKTSCIFVTNGDGKVTGYVTDITLRDRVIAKRISVENPVREVIETNLVAIDREAFIYEALLLMFQTHTRYILLTKEGEYVGFISRNKLLSEQSQSSLVFIQSVKQANSLAEVKNKWEQVPGIVQRLLERGVKAEIVNRIITAVSDTILLRVIDKVMHEMGPPPSKFVFITLGSEGRMEQTLKTDQDNAIIYEDKANEQRE